MAHPHLLIRSFSKKTNTHAQGRCLEIPQINLELAHPPACLSPLPLPLPPSSSTAPLRSASVCGARYGSAWPKDSMSALVSSPPAGEKQEAPPIRNCKGVNDLDKVVLPEVRGSSVEVPACHSRESLGMFWLSNRSIDPRRLPWCCSKPDFSVAVTTFPSPTLCIYVSSVSDVLDVCCSCFILMLQK